MKIKNLINLLDENIILKNISKLSDEFEIQCLTEYLQNVKTGSLAFVSLPADIKKSAEILEKYLPNDIDPSNFLLISNCELPEDYNHICCDIEKAKKTINEAFYPLPEDYKFIGVTGTNGKTSVVNMAVKIMDEVGVSALGLGTVGVRLGNEMLEEGSLNSTFPYTEIRRIAYENKAKANVLVMEATSHALKQKRLLDIQFNHILWTNFTQDHLDYHKTEEDYFQSKLMITNLCHEIYLPDNEVSLIKRIREAKQGYPVHEVVFKDLFDNDVPDGFIKQNLAMAIKLVELVIQEPLKIKLGLYQKYLPEGRFQILEGGEKVCIIDYAHTPDALVKLLSEVSTNFPNRKRILIFGCGGDRDRTKRPLMGQAARNNSEFVIVTSDNPRGENPQQIIDDVLPSLKGEENYLAIVDRKEAIKKGLEMADGNNVIIIAGKGHEDYQDINGVKHPFKDFDVARKYL